MPDRFTSDEVEATGHCCLHVFTEDTNLDDRSLDWGAGYAAGKGCDRCSRIAEWFRTMTELERAQWFDAHGLMCGCCRERNGLEPIADCAHGHLASGKPGACWDCLRELQDRTHGGTDA